MPTYDVVCAVSNPLRPGARRVLFQVSAASGDAAVLAAMDLAEVQFPTDAYTVLDVAPEPSGLAYDVDGDTAGSKLRDTPPRGPLAEQRRHDHADDV